MGTNYTPLDVTKLQKGKDNVLNTVLLIIAIVTAVILMILLLVLIQKKTTLPASENNILPTAVPTLKIIKPTAIPTPSPLMEATPEGSITPATPSATTAVKQPL